MSVKLYLYLVVVCLLIGACYSAFNNEILIIRWPRKSIVPFQEPSVTIKKKATLSYWHNDSWQTETNEILWNDNKTNNLMNLLKCWLSVLEQEGMTNKKISLQSIIINANGNDAFVSFDRYPFTKESSTYEKWRWIEGVLKTIRENEISLQSIRFLVHHQELIDPHLDFSQSWPLNGFL